MKRTIIDASNLELEDNVVTIKRVTKPYAHMPVFIANYY